jgi:hypothetical protein
MAHGINANLLRRWINESDLAAVASNWRSRSRHAADRRH